MADSEQPLPSLTSFIRQHRFAGLLAALLLLFFYGIIVELFATNLKPIATRVTIGIIITALLLSAVLSVSKSRRTFRNAMILGVPAILSELLDVTVFNTPTQVASHLLTAVFLSYVILVLLKSIFADKQVTTDTIFASLCIYLLLGTVWAMAYSLLTTWQPDAFWYSLDETNNSDNGRAITDSAETDSAETDNSETDIAETGFLKTRNPMRIGAEPAGLEFYYSFVTMTTLGYGDIVPVTSAARGLATLQALVGQLYLAVLVARLVGLHVADSARRKT